MKSYLLLSLIPLLLIVPNAVSALEVEPKLINTPIYNDVDLIISGELNQFLEGKRLVISIIFPDYTEENYDVRVTDKGPFALTLKINDEWQFGNYQVYGKYDEINFEETNFTIEKTADPRTITNNQNESDVQNSNETILETIENNEIILVIPASFVNPDKDPQYYIDRYYNEPKYKDWFDSNYPQYESIYQAVGIDDPLPDLILRGEKYYDEEKDYEALFFFNRILELEPSNIEIQIKKGFSLHYLERYEEAKIVFENILKLEPTNYDAIFGLAESNYYLGNLNEAKKWYENGLKLNPDNEYLLSFLGLTLTEMNDEKGLEFITESLKIDPNNSDLIFNKAIALNHFKKYQEAIDTLDLFLKIEPDDKEAIEFKNEILSESGILKQQRSEYFPKTVDSKCDLVHLLLWTQDNNWNPVFLLPPSDEVGTKLNQIQEKYLQQVKEEPWKDAELRKKAVQDVENLLLADIMKKYNISSSLKPIVREILVNPTGGDGNYVLGLMQMLPEDYTYDLQCGKILKSQYFDELYPFLEGGYGKVTADKMSIAIDEAIAEAETTQISISRVNDQKGGGCLIATATFDSELAPQVQKLREIRDSKLLQTESGSQFMESFNSFYYSFSPYIADYERENPVFKEIVKIGITPMLSTLSLMDYADTESEVLGIGISLIIVNAMMYVGLPVFGIMMLRKSNNTL